LSHQLLRGLISPSGTGKDAAAATAAAQRSALPTQWRLLLSPAADIKAQPVTDRFDGHRVTN